MFKPLSGLLNQPKYLPLRYMPLTIEFELVNNNLDPIVDPNMDPSDSFTLLNSSTSWKIQNAQVKVDMCTLDNSLDNNYAQILLSGRSLPINYNTWVSQLQTIVGKMPTINVTRALTRLKSVFVTLDKNFVASDNSATPRTQFFRKQWNDFYSPASLDTIGGLNNGNFSGSFVFRQSSEFEFQLQIGSKLFPEYPIRSHSEAYYQLQKALGIQSSNLHNFNINGVEYRDSKMIIGIDTEKVIEAGWTGINTRAGDFLTVKLKSMQDDASRYADRMHIVLHSDQILEIRDSGVQVFD